jgi:hypothetical protein
VPCRVSHLWPHTPLATRRGIGHDQAGLGMWCLKLVSSEHTMVVAGMPRPEKLHCRSCLSIATAHACCVNAKAFSITLRLRKSDTDVEGGVSVHVAVSRVPRVLQCPGHLGCRSFQVSGF